ncbi:MAG: hypothetical protein J6A06_04680 [Fibrobacteraceae bacterium]|nr:hypothetical protein [Fibrobacteraceae bacterium]
MADDPKSENKSNPPTKPGQPFDVKDLIDVAVSWFSYHVAVNRELILEEKSIKYPIADYLAQYTGDIKFEKKIDAFYDRDFDLYFRVNGKDYVFEFKFARDNYTGNPDEIQRVFNDLIRLNTVSDNMECYFMMIGEKSKFIRNFKNLGKEPVNPNLDGPSIAPANKTVPTKINPYEEMFIFENDTTKDLKDGNGVEVKNAMDDKKAEKILVFDNPDIKSRIDAFKDEKGCHYKLSKEYNDIYGSIDKYFQQIKSLKTILFRCTKDVSDSSRTGIGVWKIERA